MAKPFPTTLSKSVTPGSWRETAVIDPTIRTNFVSGSILTRARFTTSPPKIFSFTYNWLTQSDKELIEEHENEANIGSSSFIFTHPKTDEVWEVRYLSPVKYSIEKRLHSRWAVSIELFGKETQKMRTSTYRVEDLAAGIDITNRPIFVNPVAVTINSIGILTEGSPAAVDDANTVVILLEDDGSNAIVTKTYDTDPQPPSSDYEDLGSLNNMSLAAGEHIMLSVTQGTTADMPAFSIIIEWYYT